MPERQCNGCKRQDDWGCEAFSYETTKEDKKGRKGRDGKFYAWHKPAQMPLDLEGEQTFACPRQDLKVNGVGWAKLLLYYGYFQKGFLPQSGSVVDQSNKAMELFRVLDAANDAADQELDKVRNRKKAMNDRVPQDPRARGR